MLTTASLATLNLVADHYDIETIDIVRHDDSLQLTIPYGVTQHFARFISDETGDILRWDENTGEMLPATLSPEHRTNPHTGRAYIY